MIWISFLSKLFASNIFKRGFHSIKILLVFHSHCPMKNLITPTFVSLKSSAMTRIRNATSLILAEIFGKYEEIGIILYISNILKICWKISEKKLFTFSSCWSLLWTIITSKSIDMNENRRIFVGKNQKTRIGKIKRSTSAERQFINAFFRLWQACRSWQTDGRTEKDGLVSGTGPFHCIDFPGFYQSVAINKEEELAISLLESDLIRFVF